MELGMSKHRKMGHVANSNHFTGLKGSSQNRKQKLTMRQKKQKKGTHKNKYEGFSKVA